MFILQAGLARFTAKTLAEAHNTKIAWELLGGAVMEVIPMPIPASQAMPLLKEAEGYASPADKQAVLAFFSSPESDPYEHKFEDGTPVINRYYASRGI